MSMYRIAVPNHPLSPSCMTLSRTQRQLSRNAGQCSMLTNTENTGRYRLKFGFSMQAWKWNIPIGVSITLLSVLQWRHLGKRSYSVEAHAVKSPVGDLIIECYCCLPLRITSRIFGWLASTEIPVSARPILYNLYAKFFNANLQDIDVELSAFPSLVEFFVRGLKADARPINPHTDIVSPSDGRVLHSGTVTSCRVEQVKGVTYNLRYFLDGSPASPNPTLPMAEDSNDYVLSLLKNPNNRLYQLTVYLAPGDYHRFHSPTDWRINYRRHFQGKLLSVNPSIASWLPDLFAMNERVVYTGEWAGGFMAYVAVGATNVGSIKVYCDRDLVTNQRKWPNGKISEDMNLECTWVRKGELFGEFRMGSTIVLLFEAPRDFSFSLVPGQSIKVGEAFTHISELSERRARTRSNLSEGIAHALKLITTIHYRRSQERHISLRSREH